MSGLGIYGRLYSYMGRNILVLGKSLEKRSLLVVWGANTILCSWFTWSKRAYL